MSFYWNIICFYVSPNFIGWFEISNYLRQNMKCVIYALEAYLYVQELKKSKYVIWIEQN